MKGLPKMNVNVIEDNKDKTVGVLLFIIGVLHIIFAMLIQKKLNKNILLVTIYFRL